LRLTQVRSAENTSILDPAGGATWQANRTTTKAAETTSHLRLAVFLLAAWPAAR
jgi:hypothetical protein